MGASVTGWGTALPSRTLHNHELAARLDVSEGWIFERTGIRSRRIVGAGETSTSLAVEACSKALDRAGVAAADVDMVIVATATPEFQLPATASLVQSALGCGKAGAFDVNAACSGFLYALAQAEALVANASCGTVLVCGSEVLSSITDYTDARSCVLFGDGAGAVVVQHNDMPAIGPFIFRSEGQLAEMLYVRPDERLIRMHGREVYRHAVDAMSDVLTELLMGSGSGFEDVDLIVAHQANGRILEAIASRLGIELQKFALNIEHVGNTSSASIPLALADAAESGRLRAGDTVALTAFGAGFTWGAGLVRWGQGTTLPAKQGRIPALVGTLAHLLEVV